jgi:hypothetical protein
MKGHYAVAGAVLFASLIAAWMGRYSFEVRGQGAPVAVLDRWSGTISVCSPAKCVSVLPSDAPH